MPYEIGFRKNPPPSAHNAHRDATSMADAKGIVVQEKKELNKSKDRARFRIWEWFQEKETKEAL